MSHLLYNSTVVNAGGNEMVWNEKYSHFHMNPIHYHHCQRQNPGLIGPPERTFLKLGKTNAFVFLLNKDRWKIKSPKNRIFAMCWFCYLNLLILSYFSVSIWSTAQRVDGVRRSLPGIPVRVPVFGSCQCKANWVILFSYHEKKKKKRKPLNSIDIEKILNYFLHFFLYLSGLKKDYLSENLVQTI